MADVRNDSISDREADADHWLMRPKSIRGLWIGFATALALTLLAQVIVPIKSYSSFDRWPGFGAAFGFGACVLMVVVAKAIGALLKRDDDYYDA